MRKWIFRGPSRSCLLQGDIARYHDHRHSSLGDCFANGRLNDPRHLGGARDELYVMAALLEQEFRMGLLKVCRADFGTRNVRRNGDDRRTTSMAIVQSVDKVQIAGPTAARADGEISREFRLTRSLAR